MRLSKSIILVCLLGIVVSISVYVFIPYTLVQGIAVGCLSSFIVTLGVSLMTYKSDNIEYLRQTHASLKQIYHDLVCISNWVLALSSESIGLAVFHKGMDLEDIQVQYELLEKVIERSERLENLNDKAILLGSYLGVLVADSSKVQGFKPVCKGKNTHMEIVSYKATLDNLAGELRNLVEACWAVIAYYETVRGIGVLDTTLRRALHSSDELLVVVDRLQDLTGAVKTLTEELILKVEVELGSNLGGSPWVAEKQTADVATSCTLSRELYSLK